MTAVVTQRYLRTAWFATFSLHAFDLAVLCHRPVCSFQFRSRKPEPFHAFVRYYRPYGIQQSRALRAVQQATMQKLSTHVQHPIHALGDVSLAVGEEHAHELRQARHNILAWLECERPA